MSVFHLRLVLLLSVVLRFKMAAVACSVVKRTLTKIAVLARLGGEQTAASAAAAFVGPTTVPSPSTSFRLYCSRRSHLRRQLTGQGYTLTTLTHSHELRRRFPDHRGPSQNRRRSCHSAAAAASFSSADDSNNSDSDDAAAVARRTRDWVRRVVVGMNLCPFADLRKVGIRVNFSDDETELLDWILEEMIRLSLQNGSTRDEDDDVDNDENDDATDDAQTPTTVLLVCPNCHPDDFVAYLDVVRAVEDGLIKEFGLDGVVQVAPFHPLFAFDDGGDGGGNEDGPVEHGGDNVDNWTNRSPYPIFHLLLEDDVTAAVAKFDGDASRIWQRNVDLLAALSEEIGDANVARFCRGDTNDGGLDDEVRERIRRVVRSFPSKPGETGYKK